MKHTLRTVPYRREEVISIIHVNAGEFDADGIPTISRYKTRHSFAADGTSRFNTTSYW